MDLGPLWSCLFLHSLPNPMSHYVLEVDGERSLRKHKLLNVTVHLDSNVKWSIDLSLCLYVVCLSLFKKMMTK